jgi:hypothetical protein
LIRLGLITRTLGAARSCLPGALIPVSKFFGSADGTLKFAEEFDWAFWMPDMSIRLCDFTRPASLRRSQYCAHGRESLRTESIRWQKRGGRFRKSFKLSYLITFFERGAPKASSTRASTILLLDFFFPS